jgi:hypothetical protein
MEDPLEDHLLVAVETRCRVMTRGIAPSPGPPEIDDARNATSAEPLERIAMIADQLGATSLAGEARALAERVTEGRFYVACVGQFKRGKSTLLDALIGDRILPTGVVPVTTVPTVVRYGPQRLARVRARGEDWREIDPETLAQYVSEEYNPENQKGIEAVEVFVPNALLASGMCLVDTPGIGSVFAGNTEATHGFVPHIDAALVVIGADPPLSGDELALVEAVAQHVPDLIFVLNKADRVPEEERTQALAFARRVLERRLGRPPTTIFQVSAAERLEGRGPEREWPALVTALEHLVCGSGRAMSERAYERGLTRLARQLLAVIEVERSVLLRPVEDSERRIEALGRTIGEAEDSLGELAHRLAREQQRLARELADRRDVFLRAALPDARAELAAALRELDQRWGPAFRREAMDAAQEIAKRHVLPWLAMEQTHAEEAYRRTTLRFVELANDFLDRLAALDDPELEALPHALDPERGLRTKSGFYFHDLLRIAHPASPLRYGLDVLLGALGASAHIRRDADRFLVQLLTMNAARVQGDLDQRMSESRRQLEADIRIALGSVRTTAERALARARIAHAAGEAQVQGALDDLLRQRTEIEALGSRSPAPADPRGQ